VSSDDLEGRQHPLQHAVAPIGVQFAQAGQRSFVKGDRCHGLV
jgi:hypothetical protein